MWTLLVGVIGSLPDSASLDAELVEAVARLSGPAHSVPRLLDGRGEDLRGDLAIASVSWADRPAHPAPPAEVVAMNPPVVIRCGNPRATVVAAEIARHHWAIGHCWQHALDHGRPAEGRLVVVTTIAADGAVLSVERDPRSDLADGAVADCVLGLFRAMEFPPSHGVLVVRYPLLFWIAP